LVAPKGSASAWCGGESLLLDSILQTAEQLAPGTHVGICVANSDATYTTLAGTDTFVAMLDELQYDLDEGPGLTAMLEEHTVIVDDAENEHRWPRFRSRAVDLGLRSHLGVPICAEGRTLGGLGRAIGLLMERFDLDDHEAFERVAMWSQKTNVRLRDLAAHLVKQANDLHQRTEAARPRHEQRSPCFTLTPGLDATDDPELDASAAVRPLTEFTMQSVRHTLLSDL
jgi:hypothetical protein